MKTKFVIFVSLFLLFMSDSFAQANLYKKLIASGKESIEIDVGESKGFLFNQEVTEQYFSRKRFRYLNYWKISICDLEEIDAAIDEYLTIHYRKKSIAGDKDYIRQYFPFINKDGEMVVGVTLSLLNAKEYERNYERMSKYFRMIYDGGDRYVFLMYNYTKNAFMKI